MLVKSLQLVKFAAIQHITQIQQTLSDTSGVVKEGKPTSALIKEMLLSLLWGTQYNL